MGLGNILGQYAAALGIGVLHGVVLDKQLQLEETNDMCGRYTDPNINDTLTDERHKGTMLLTALNAYSHINVSSPGEAAAGILGTAIIYDFVAGWTQTYLHNKRYGATLSDEQQEIVDKAVDDYYQALIDPTRRNKKGIVSETTDEASILLTSTGNPTLTWMFLRDLDDIVEESKKYHSIRETFTNNAKPPFYLNEIKTENAIVIIPENNHLQIYELSYERIRREGAATIVSADFQPIEKVKWKGTTQEILRLKENYEQSVLFSNISIGTLAAQAMFVSAIHADTAEAAAVDNEIAELTSA